MEKIIRKIISCRMIYYILAIILFTATHYLNFKEKLKTLINNEEVYLKQFLLASIISGIIVVLLLIFSKKIYKHLKPHIAYIIFALIIGGIYVFLIPICAQSDEPAHIYRTFEIANGGWVSNLVCGESRTQFPKSLLDMIEVNTKDKKRENKRYSDIEEMKAIELNEDKTILMNDIQNATIGKYHGISYLPQVIGVKIGLALKLNPYYIIMLGRLTGLVITVLLLSYGIYKLPTHKLFASIILLSPVVLSYAASISADCITLSSIFIMISYVLMFKHTKKEIKIFDYIILGILTCIVSLSKMTYLPIIGVLLFIPKKSYKNDINLKILVSFIFILIGILVSIFWMKISDIRVISGIGINDNTWIYSNPIEYLIIVFRTTIVFAYNYIQNMFVGDFLCHRQINPYEIIPLIYIIIIVYSYFQDENKEKTTMWQKLGVFIIIILSYVLISTSMYLYNTEYKGELIIGVQGRYLLPILFLGIFFGNKKKVEIQEHKLVNISLILNYAIYLAMLEKFFI